MSYKTGWVDTGRKQWFCDKMVPSYDVGFATHAIGNRKLVTLTFVVASGIGKRMRFMLFFEKVLEIFNCLEIPGRPKEAEKLFIRKTNMQIEDKDWENASVGYHNLADLKF